ncbi:MAG TPA: hypothetical protein VFN18_04840 [Solirubrobacterales bacterium]|nr:hypothetical protein [Solirubrobacterales bacterium]
MRRRLLQLIGERSPGLEISTGLATRSTLGPGTIILRPAGGSDDAELDDLAAWLGEQPGVEQVARKKSALHVRLELEALRAWFCDGWQEEAPADGESPKAGVAMPEPESPCSLGDARRQCVGRAIAVLLGEGVEVEVAEVDTRHDRLRARHGGSVTLENLLADIRDDSILLEDRTRSEEFAEALVSYLMTHVPRTRRLGIDNEIVGQKLTELDEILAAQALAEEKFGATSPHPLDLAPQGEDRIRAVVGLLESAPSVRASARNQLDPAPVNRLLRLAAQAVEAARDDLPDGDPLWLASARTLEEALGVVAPTASHLAPASNRS